MKTKRMWIVLVTMAVLTAAGIAAWEGASAQGRAEEGRREFVNQGCHGCHTLGGKLGTPIAPDLSHVGTKYSETYLTAWLRDPAQQRPSAHMPKLELTNTQIAALAAFLASQR